MAVVNCGIYDFSESETLVGKWIDGKPLYQKTVNFGLMPNKTSKEVDAVISNVDNVVHTFGVMIGMEYNITYTAKFNYFEGNKMTTIQDMYYVYKKNLSVYVFIRTIYNRSMYTAYITLQYTKTTD